MIALRSNRTVTPAGIIPAVLIISDGVIVDIIKELPDSIDCDLFDAGDKVLMPGVVDPHVHINEPGRMDWEGFETATKSAIAGGITMLVDMPLNSTPVTTTAENFTGKINSSKDKLYTNVGLWGGVVPGNANELEELIEKGVLGFKAFLTHSGIDEFPNVTEEDLRKAMPVIAKYNLPLLVHCELSDDQHPCKGDPRVYSNYLSTRPGKWEDDAIALMIRLCEEFNCRVHIVHLSSANSIEQIRKAKQRGLPLTVETGQHYLFYAAEEIPDGETKYKCAPPIRGKENNDQLWQALKEGVIDFVATDHSPSTPNLKEMESGDFMKAWGGIASLQLALPVLWTAARERNCKLEDIAKWLSSNPSKLIGKENKKGIIAKGYDADLVVWDPDGKFTVTKEMLHHRHKITPYLDQELYGIVEQTFLGGKKVFDKGEIISKAGKIIYR